MKVDVKRFIKEGYKYYPIWLADLYDKYRRYRDVEVHPLIKSVYSFDNTYHLSDSSSAYRSGRAAEAELKELINGSDFSNEDKSYLIAGLSNGSGYKEFKKHFPETCVFEIRRHKEILAILDENKYDEELIDKYLAHLSVIKALLEEIEYGEGGKDFIIWTEGCRKISREDIQNNELYPLTIRNDLQKRLRELIKAVDVDELKLVYDIQCYTSDYLNVGTTTSPNYQRVNAIPEMGFRWVKVEGNSALNFRVNYYQSFTLIL